MYGKPLARPNLWFTDRKRTFTQHRVLGGCRSSVDTITCWDSGHPFHFFHVGSSTLRLNSQSQAPASPTPLNTPWRSEALVSAASLGCHFVSLSISLFLACLFPFNCWMKAKEFHTEKQTGKTSGRYVLFPWLKSLMMTDLQKHLPFYPHSLL